MRTIKKTRTVFATLLLSVIGGSIYYVLNQPAYVSANNKFYVEPREAVDDYFKVTVKNIDAVSGEKMVQEEFGIVKITDFNRLIKR